MRSPPPDAAPRPPARSEGLPLVLLGAFGDRRRVWARPQVLSTPHPREHRQRAGRRPHHAHRAEGPGASSPACWSTTTSRCRRATPWWSSTPATRRCACCRPRPTSRRARAMAGSNRRAGQMQAQLSASRAHAAARRRPSRPPKPRFGRPPPTSSASRRLAATADRPGPAARRRGGGVRRRPRAHARGRAPAGGCRGDQVTASGRRAAGRRRPAGRGRGGGRDRAAPGRLHRHHRAGGRDRGRAAVSRSGELVQPGQTLMTLVPTETSG